MIRFERSMHLFVTQSTVAHLVVLPELDMTVLLIDAKCPAISADGRAWHETLMQLKLGLGLKDASYRIRTVVVARRWSMLLVAIVLPHFAWLAAAPAAAVLFVIGIGGSEAESSGKEKEIVTLHRSFPVVWCDTENSVLLAMPLRKSKSSLGSQQLPASARWSQPTTDS